jgi:light-harvesting protein B-800-850 alpha chain
MNQGKIWLVVKPTVGLPLFLGGVTVIALAVHAAILTHTSWFPAYYAGGTKAKTATVETTAPVAVVDSSKIVVAKSQ